MEIELNDSITEMQYQIIVVKTSEAERTTSLAEEQLTKARNKSQSLSPIFSY